MRNSQKMVACFVAFTVTASSIAVSGCGKKPKGTNEVISADSIWYNMEKHEFALDYDVTEYQYISDSALGKVGDNYAIETSGDLIYPDDADWDNLNYSDYYVNFIDIFDEQGNLVNSIDLVDAVRDSGVIEDFKAYRQEDDEDEQEPEDQEEAGEESSDEDVETSSETDTTDEDPDFTFGMAKIAGDNIAVDVSFFDISGYRTVNYTVTVDPITGASSFEMVENDYDDGYSEGTYNVGGYQVEPIWISDAMSSYYLIKVSDDNGLVNSINLSEKIPYEAINYIDNIFSLDEDTILVMYNSFGTLGHDKYLTVNVNTGEVTLDEAGEYTWINNCHPYNCEYFDGIGNVILNDEGIQILDFDNKTLSEVFSFDYCNVNRYDISNMQLVDYTEDKITFIGTLYRGANLSLTELSVPQLIVLTKADSNPNAGKTVLAAASLSEIDYATSEAVCIFNENSTDYFIRFVDEYKTDKFVEAVDFNDPEASQTAYDEAAAELSDQLTIDLMAGDGPDIIFGASSLSQLNNENYLLDLSNMTNTDGLFTNVIESAKTGDKLYQLPLTFGVTGLAVLNDNLEAGQTGFTFDQYGDFVSGPCNGQDPLAMDKTEFFILCMEAMSEQFFTEDGKVSYDNEAFRSLAEYTSENVIPPVDTGVEDYYGFSDTSSEMAEVGATRFELSYFDAFVQLLGKYANESTIVGLPSVDGRGPMLSVSNSVAISSQSAEADACRSFIETLLSSQIQEYYGIKGDVCPISKAAFETSAHNTVDCYNDMIRLQARFMSEASLAMMGIDTTEIDYSVIDNYEAMIDSCSSVSATDPAVTAIIREEMPAYFSGQKTLDEVIPIMEERVQTFLDERG